MEMTYTGVRGEGRGWRGGRRADGVVSDGAGRWGRDGVGENRGRWGFDGITEQGDAVVGRVDWMEGAAMWWLSC